MSDRCLQKDNNWNTLLVQYNTPRKWSQPRKYANMFIYGMAKSLTRRMSLPQTLRGVGNGGDLWCKRALWAPIEAHMPTLPPPAHQLVSFKYPIF